MGQLNVNQLFSISRWKAVLLFSFFELSLGLSALLTGYFIHINPFEKLHFTWIAVRGGILTTFLALFLITLMTMINSSAFLQQMAQLKSWLSTLFKNWTLTQFLLISICAGIGEELLFRGLIQEGLMRLMGAWPALIITGTVFGMVHWHSNYYFIYATFMGMFLGALYWQSGNLLAPIICHTLYDFIVLIFLMRWFFKRLKN
jgi:membrane protease YdiL (CAAX protease family)